LQARESAVVIVLERAVPEPDDRAMTMTFARMAVAVTRPRESGEQRQGDDDSGSTPGEESDLGSHREHLLP